MFQRPFNWIKFLINFVFIKELKLKKAVNKSKLTERTKDRFPAGFETVARHKIGESKTQEFEIETKGMQDFSLMIQTQDGDVDGILLEMKKSDGSMVSNGLVPYVII